MPCKKQLLAPTLHPTPSFSTMVAAKNGDIWSSPLDPCDEIEFLGQSCVAHLWTMMWEQHELLSH